MEGATAYTASATALSSAMATTTPTATVENQDGQVIEEDADSDSIAESEDLWDVYEDVTVDDVMEHCFGGLCIDPEITYEAFFDRFYSDFESYLIRQYELDSIDCEIVFGMYWEQFPEGFAEPVSLYKRGCKPSRYDSGGTALDYESCSSSQLRNYISQRCLIDPFPSGLTLKYYYVRVLEAADQAPQFRFMQLPSEMRLRIYRELLLFSEHEEKKHCHPNILRVSKEIHNEANSVLYDDNVFCVDFTLQVDHKKTINARAKVHNSSILSGCPHSPFLRMPGGIEDYPGFLLRISRLRIKLAYTIEAKDAVSDKEYHPLNNYLATLASFLMDGHRLRKVEVSADLPSMAKRTYEHLLWPLRRLCGVKVVEIISAQIPVKCKVSLIADMTSTQRKSNTMKQWKLLADEASAQLSLIRDTAKLCEECDSDDSRECGHGNKISSLMFDVKYNGRKGFTNREREGLLTYVLDELRDELDSLDLDVVGKRLHELKQKRNAFDEFIEHDTLDLPEPMDGEEAAEARLSSSPTPSER